MNITKITLTNAITLGTQRYTEITPDAGELGSVGDSVDMVFADLPYGVTANKWDNLSYGALFGPDYVDQMDWIRKIERAIPEGS